MGNWRFVSRKGNKFPIIEEMREKSRERVRKRQQKFREQEDHAVQEIHTKKAFQAVSLLISLAPYCMH